MLKLTNKQKRVLDYVNRYWVEHGFGPSMDDIREGLSFKNRNAAHCHVVALVKKKVLLMAEHTPRSIRSPWMRVIIEKLCQECGGLDHPDHRCLCRREEA